MVRRLWTFCYELVLWTVDCGLWIFFYELVCYEQIQCNFGKNVSFVSVRTILNGHPNIPLIEPMEYESFVFLMRQAYLILTDSGGIQEEAASLGKPVLVMRNTTQRPEGVEAGTTRLVGTERKAIENGVLELIENSQLYNRMARRINPYGDGQAAERIAKILRHCMAGAH